MRSKREYLKPVVDSRLTFYRMVKQAVAIVVAVLVMKAFILDSFAVKGDQMVPSIMNGDRVLALRLPYVSFLRELSSPSRGEPVIFSLPSNNQLGCLRVAGLSGDTVMVSRGEFWNSRDTAFHGASSNGEGRTGNEVLPPEFSPRDYIDPFRVPAPGDTFALDSLGLYAFFSALSVIRQENPKSACSLETQFSFNDTLVRGYVIADFLFYKGTIESVPDSLRFDWFFWSRLKEYLRQAHRDRKVTLTFTFERDGERVDRYVVKERFLFLLADNWNNGLDSRYLGPIAASRVVGKPFFVLWSFSRRPDQTSAFDTKRIGRIVR